MADKHLYNNGGAITEREAITTTTGAGDAGKHIAANGSGKLDATFLPDGVGPDTIAIVCSENLAAGDLVSLWSDSGTGKVRKADASNGRRADGYVKDAYASGQTATVYFDCTNDDLSGMTPGATQYLSGSTAGARTETAPTTAGYIVQEVGRARSATEMTFQPYAPITLA